MTTASTITKCCNDREFCIKTGKHDTCHLVFSQPLADRKNDGKVQLTLIPYEAQKQEALVMMFGAKKYSRDNWKKGLPFLSVCDSILRHVNAYIQGETNDPESGLPHMAHLRCNAAFLIEFGITHPELDDRKPKS